MHFAIQQLRPKLNLSSFRNLHTKPIEDVVLKNPPKHTNNKFCIQSNNYLHNANNNAQYHTYHRTTSHKQD